MLTKSRNVSKPNIDGGNEDTGMNMQTLMMITMSFTHYVTEILV